MIPRVAPPPPPPTLHTPSSDEIAPVERAQDFLMIPVSILFVFSYMMFHMRALTLAALGMCMIVLSMPLALFVYAPVVPYFSQLHNLAIFIVLGVGADDIFVFTDAWKQSAAMPPPATYARRMAVTWRRAAGSVFTTSFTTAVAFFATAISPVMPIGAFGIFAALAIVMNFVLVTTWWPPVLVIWETWLASTPCCGGYLPFVRQCRRPRPIEPADLGYGCPCTSAPEAHLVAGPPRPDGKWRDMNLVERFFRNRYSPALLYRVRGIKLVALACVLITGTAGLVLTWRALLLEPPIEEERRDRAEIAPRSSREYHHPRAAGGVVPARPHVHRAVG